MNNRCYTYFRIVGKFYTDDISHILNLTPEKKWDIGDVRPNGIGQMKILRSSPICGVNSPLGIFELCN